MNNPLKKYLEKEGLTQESLAERIGISFMTLSRIINGRNKDVRASTIKKFHKKTKIPYNILIEYFTK